MGEEKEDCGRCHGAFPRRPLSAPEEKKKKKGKGGRSETGGQYAVRPLAQDLQPSFQSFPGEKKKGKRKRRRRQKMVVAFPIGTTAREKKKKERKKEKRITRSERKPKLTLPANK